MNSDQDVSASVLGDEDSQLSQGILPTYMGIPHDIFVPLYYQENGKILLVNDDCLLAWVRYLLVTWAKWRVSP